MTKLNKHLVCKLRFESINLRKQRIMILKKMVDLSHQDEQLSNEDRLGLKEAIDSHFLASYRSDVELY